MGVRRRCPSADRGAAVPRGTLRIYLGAAPGVGKTYAMLSEAQRRAARGTDVAVVVVDAKGRPNTAAELAGLEGLIGATSTRLVGPVGIDVEAVLRCGPEVALVDDYAHTSAAGRHDHPRWIDVETLLDAGVDVITTLNIQHLDSLVDVVSTITG